MISEWFLSYLYKERVIKVGLVEDLSWKSSPGAKVNSLKTKKREDEEWEEM